MEKESKKCIICGQIKNKNEFSIEHIIPESFGNKRLVTNMVCEKCNNLLGTKVDKHITASTYGFLIRHIKKFKNKNNEIPAPFKNGYIIDENNNQRRVIFKDLYKPILETYVENLDDNHRIIVGSSEESLKKVIDDLYRKGKLTIEEKNMYIEQVKEATHKECKSPIYTKIESNQIGVELEFIKIAYEYACLKLGEEYYNDDYAKKMRELLHTAIYKNEIEKSDIITRFIFSEELVEMCFSIDCKQKKNHIIIMSKKEEKIDLLIILAKDNYLSYRIKITEKASCYNCISKKKIFNLIEVI